MQPLRQGPVGQPPRPHRGAPGRLRRDQRHAAGVPSTAAWRGRPARMSGDPYPMSFRRSPPIRSGGGSGPGPPPSLRSPPSSGSRERAGARGRCRMATDGALPGGGTSGSYKSRNHDRPTAGFGTRSCAYRPSRAGWRGPSGLQRGPHARRSDAGRPNLGRGSHRENPSRRPQLRDDDPGGRSSTRLYALKPGSPGAHVSRDSGSETQAGRSTGAPQAKGEAAPDGRARPSGR